MIQRINTDVSEHVNERPLDDDRVVPETGPALEMIDPGLVEQTEILPTSPLSGKKSRDRASKSRGLNQELVPPRLRKFANELFNQQMWCWGCDIRRPDGNLLRQYGFVKHAAPEQSGLKPCYSLESPDGTTIALWGWGMFFAQGDGDGLFLKRFGFSPRLMPLNGLSFDVWSPFDLPVSRLPADRGDWHRAADLLSASLRWVGSYERWVVSEAGEPYRTESVEAWRKFHRRVAVDGRSMADAWAGLAADCAGTKPGTSLYAGGASR